MDNPNFGQNWALSNDLDFNDLGALKNSAPTVWFPFFPRQTLVGYRETFQTPTQTDDSRAPIWLHRLDFSFHGNGQSVLVWVGEIMFTLALEDL